jgi:hypothetical protein
MKQDNMESTIGYEIYKYVFVTQPKIVTMSTFFFFVRISKDVIGGSLGAYHRNQN